MPWFEIVAARNIFISCSCVCKYKRYENHDLEAPIFMADVVVEEVKAYTVDQQQSTTFGSSLQKC